MTRQDEHSNASGEQAVANLLASYAFLNDDADFDGLGQLFSEAVFTLDGAVARGADEVAALARAVIQIREDGRSATAHEVTNLIIEVDEQGGLAAAKAYWTVYQSVSGAPRAAALSGRYDAKFERLQSVWRFRECHAVSLWRATAD